MVDAVGPDGVVHSFPDGTDKAVIHRTLAKRYGWPAQPGPTLTPVDHNPFEQGAAPQPRLTPVDHNPFADQSDPWAEFRQPNNQQPQAKGRINWDDLPDAQPKGRVNFDDLVPNAPGKSGDNPYRQFVSPQNPYAQFVHDAPGKPAPSSNPKTIMLDIQGHKVEVGREFLDLSPDKQSETVDEIAGHMGIAAPGKSRISFDDLIPNGGHGQSVAADAAKSLAGGAAQGIVGLPGLVLGDAQNLGKAAPWAPQRSMLDALLEKAGISHLPTSQDFVDKAGEYVPEIKYQPQTDIGKVAHTVGEFLPGSVMGGGGGMARNAMRFGVAPGVVSEGLGQATEGTAAEPYARAVGGVLGAMAGPRLANIPGRMVSPMLTRPEIAGHVALLEKEGIPLTAGQKTGSKALQWAEATAADLPFASKSAADINAEQGAALNRAFTKRMGYEAPNMGDAEWQAARDRFSNPQSGLYPQLTSRNTLKMDQQLLGDVGQAVGDYMQKTTPATRDPWITKVVKDLGDLRQSGGTIPGQQYQGLRSELEKEASLADRTGKGREAAAMRGIKSALDQAMSRSISPQDAALWQKTNQEYAALKTLENAAKGAGEQNAMGYISPQRVRGETAKRTSAYLQGKSELGNIAQAAEAVMKPLPNSGTAQRGFYQKMFTPGAGAYLGHLLAGGIPGAVAGAAAPAVAGRVLLSKPVQKYLANDFGNRLGLISHPPTSRRNHALAHALRSGGQHTE